VGGVLNPDSPYISNISEDAIGLKYVTKYGGYGYHLYGWNQVSSSWDVKFSPDSNQNFGFRAELQMNQAYGAPLSYWIQRFMMHDPVQINVASSKVDFFAISPTQFMVAADQAVEYSGLLVNNYQPTTGTSTYLYSLPSEAEVVLGLGITLNASPYRMLCIPERNYLTWDGKTHYCMLANDVKYRDATFVSTPAPAGNDVISFLVTIDPAGNTYQLLSQQTLTETAGLQERPVNMAADFPMFAAQINRTECTGSVDSQGNYHNFCYAGNDTQTVHYEFYDKNNPTVPMYAQTLP